LCTVEFDRHLSPRTREIDDIRTDWVLSPKSVCCAEAVKRQSKLFFHIGRISAQSPSDMRPAPEQESPAEFEDVEAVQAVDQVDEAARLVDENVVRLHDILALAGGRHEMIDLLRAVRVRNVDRPEAAAEPGDQNHVAVDRLLRLVRAEPAVAVEPRRAAPARSAFAELDTTIEGFIFIDSGIDCLKNYVS
jgi:hypothetical protein